MKLYFEDLNEARSFTRGDIQSEVYNALADIAYSHRKLPSDELQHRMDLAIDWFQSRFWEIDWEEDDDMYTESLHEDKDLTRVEGTIAKLIDDHYKELMAASSAQNMKDMVIKLFADNNIDTPYSKKMIKVEFPKKKTLTQMQSYITNVWLAGSGNAVIK